MIEVNQQELNRFHKEMERMIKAVDRAKINRIQTRHARPIVRDMKAGARSTRLSQMIGTTTRQGKRPRAPKIGIRIGVINNKTSLFPTFTAPALASVEEYGTAERQHRSGKSVGAHPAAPFLRPAWDRNIRDFIRNFEQDLIREVEK